MWTLDGVLLNDIGVSGRGLITEKLRDGGGTGAAVPLEFGGVLGALRLSDGVRSTLGVAKQDPMGHSISTLCRRRSSM